MSTLAHPAPTICRGDGATQIYQQVQPGTAAEDALVVSYLPLVKHVVGRIAMTLPPHVPADDLQSAGMVGLLNAVRNYNPECRTSFETYARLRIRGAILDELRRLDWVPRSVHERSRQIESVIQKFEQLHGRTPTDSEVAAELKLSPAQYEEVLSQIRPSTFLSLDAMHPVSDDADGCRYDTVADQTQELPPEVAGRRELSRLVAERLDSMPLQQKRVLAMYYFEDLRLREIAVVLGVTESRVCQIHSQAILSLRAFIRQQEAAVEDAG